MSDSQDETKVQPPAGADGRPRPGSAGQRSPGSGAQAPSAQGSSAQGSGRSSSGGQSAQGPAKAGASRPTSGASGRSSSSASTRASGPSSGTGRTLTAADYARTTRGSADQTSVIPAIADPGASSSSTASTSANASSGTGRQARLRLNHVEPWSVTRIAFIVSVALMIVSTVAVLIFWVVLDVVGVWDQINGSVSNVLSDDSSGFDLTDYLGLGRLTGLTLLLSAINVLVFTALATIGAHLYNLGAQLLGGIQVTFSDD